MEWLLAITACASAAALLGVVVLGVRVRNAENAVRSAARLPTSFDSRLNALAERQDAVEALLQKIDARDRMRRVRAGRSEETEPNPYQDPQGWKAAMRNKRARGDA